jgi:hypothetical protein
MTYEVTLGHTPHPDMPVATGRSPLIRARRGQSKSPQSQKRLPSATHISSATKLPVQFACRARRASDFVLPFALVFPIRHEQEPPHPLRSQP